MEAKLSELQSAVNSEDTEAMKRGIQAVQQEAMAMGQAMYASGGGGGAGGAGGAGSGGAGPGSGGSGRSGDDNVIDAEFK